MEHYHHIRLFLAASFLSLQFITPLSAQFPFPSSDDEEDPDVNVPESVPTDLIVPRYSPRDSAADNLTRLFSRDLREIESRQAEIIDQLNQLPGRPIETFTQSAFGYHSRTNNKRPKEIVIDLGESVEPDGIALFPVTVQDNNGETIFGYGFPKTFEVHFSDTPEFSSSEAIPIFDMGDSPRRYPVFRELSGYEGRYVRIRAIDLWRRDKIQAFALSEVMILKGEQNLALGKKVKAKDSYRSGNKWSDKFVNDGITAFGIPQGNQKSPSIGYRSSTKSDVQDSWVQVDLGESLNIEEVRIILANDPNSIPDPQVRFAYPITVQVSENEDMKNPDTLGRFTPTETTQIGNNPLVIPVEDGYGRFVRIRVTQPKAGPMNFSLAELQIFSENQNVALGKPVRGSHPRSDKNYGEAFLVDGFSSRFNLVSYQSWVSDLEKRVELDRELELLENDRLNLVDRTFTRSVIASAGSLLGALGLSLFFVLQSRVRRRKDLENLRQRIASDLHDDIGSNLSSIALLAELGKTEASEPDLVVEELTEIKLTADKTIESMKDIVWLIRPGEETWKQMMTRFRETAANLLRTHEYTFDETGQMHDDRLPLEFKRDFFLIYKEVLNNIVRHANASKVSIEVGTKRGKLDLTIEDDGIGFDKLDSDFREGNGLRNLRMRSQAIGAKLQVKSRPGSGTIINLTAPLP